MSVAPAELSAFLGWLERLPNSAEPVLAGLFTGTAPIVLGRAPGRLDVMGGFADYSGSLTLELPLREAAYVAVQARAEPVVQVVSCGPSAGALRSVRLPLAELQAHSQSYASAQAYFRRSAADAWVAYVAGVLVALQLELDRPLSTGISILVASSVPEGKGVSSSAALEVGTLSALVGLHQLSVDAVRAAALCQRVENLVVGAPCGIMDQLTSSCGVEGQVLPIVCQPAELQAGFSLPPSLALWGIDSGLRHEVSGADYTEVRVAAFMGYRWLAELRGWPVRREGEGKVRVADPEWAGYLARVDRADFDRQYRERLPERLTGEEFLQRLGGITDSVTSVRPGATYRVRAATTHPVHEHARAREFRELLSQPELSPELTGFDARRQQSQLERLGALMLEAHGSYSACGLGSAGTDRLVQRVREQGPERGLFGAKSTGGGSGGTVAVLGLASAGAAVADVAARYGRETGRSPQVFSGSSPGAAAFGVRRWEPAAACWRREPGFVQKESSRKCPLVSR